MMKLKNPLKAVRVGRKSTYKAAVDLDDEGMIVELVGVADNSVDAESRRDRVQILIAKIILLGRTRGRPRKEATDEEQIAA